MSGTQIVVPNLFDGREAGSSEMLHFYLNVALSFNVSYVALEVLKHLGLEEATA